MNLKNKTNQLILIITVFLTHSREMFGQEGTIFQLAVKDQGVFVPTRKKRTLPKKLKHEALKKEPDIGPRSPSPFSIHPQTIHLRGELNRPNLYEADPEFREKLTRILMKGHAIKRHYGLLARDLKYRLKTENIPEATTFRNADELFNAVFSVFRFFRLHISSFKKRQLPGSKLIITLDLQSPVGRGYYFDAQQRKTSNTQAYLAVRVIIKKQAGGSFVVQTAYPCCIRSAYR